VRGEKTHNLIDGWRLAKKGEKEAVILTEQSADEFDGFGDLDWMELPTGATINQLVGKRIC
jgi:hypothetical protein